MRARSCKKTFSSIDFYNSRDAMVLKGDHLCIVHQQPFYHD
jgi:hypothetical protein